MPGTFVLQGSTDGQFYFNLRAENNEVLLTSERYKAKASAQSGIEATRDNSPSDSRYSRRTSTDQKHYFVLLAANGEPLGTSETYSSTAAMENGIKAVKRNAPIAAVVDRT
jgi:uncharacterized protein